MQGEYLSKKFDLLTTLLIAAAFAYFGYLIGVAAREQSAPAAPEPPVAAKPAATYAPDEWKVWQDGEYDKSGKTWLGYVVRYPRDFEVTRGEEAAGGFIGKPKVRIAFPEDAFRQPKTNYGEAYMTVSVGGDPASLKDCDKNPMTGGKDALSGAATVGGVKFMEGDVHDAAAGNLYDTKLYRAAKDGRCYEIALTVHTGNIMNYDVGTVEEFDKQQAYAVLRKMLDTFAFTDKNPNL